MRRTPIRRVSARRRKRDAAYPAARQAVFARADGLCEARIWPVCTGQCEQVHHKAGRGGPSPHALDGLLGVCHRCHEWIELNREASYRLGFLVRRNVGPAPDATT